MKNKVSGIMRVKNDGQFIERCVESCIDALDELIIVHNDCTDNSVPEIEKMAARYPEKIKVYAYPHHIYGINISKEEYELAKSLPEDAPNLLCTYCNFALSKVTSAYAVKIDADQVYFTDQLKSWCDFMRVCTPQKMSLKVFAGKLFSTYVSAYRFLSLKCGRALPLMPEWLAKRCNSAYLSYAQYLFSHDKACLALSGVNVLEDNETLISACHALGNFKSISSFNGCGDTVIFKVTDSTRYVRFIMPEYISADNKSYSVLESFNCPTKMMFIGFFWKHLKMMRPETIEYAMELHRADPDAYMPIDKFAKFSFNEIQRQSTGSVYPLFQHILFAFIYNANKENLFRSLRKQQEFESKKNCRG